MDDEAELQGEIRAGNESGLGRIPPGATEAEVRKLAHRAEEELDKTHRERLRRGP